MFWIVRMLAEEFKVFPAFLQVYSSTVELFLNLQHPSRNFDLVHKARLSHKKFHGFWVILPVVDVELNVVDKKSKSYENFRSQSKGRKSKSFA